MAVFFWRLKKERGVAVVTMYLSWNWHPRAVEKENPWWGTPPEKKEEKGLLWMHFCQEKQVRVVKPAAANVMWPEITLLFKVRHSTWLFSYVHKDNCEREICIYDIFLAILKSNRRQIGITRTARSLLSAEWLFGISSRRVWAACLVSYAGRGPSLFTLALGIQKKGWGAGDLLTTDFPF